MKITEIGIKIVKNLGNYEACHYELRASIDNQNEVERGFEVLKAFIDIKHKEIYKTPAGKSPQPDKPLTTPPKAAGNEELKQDVQHYLEGKLTIEEITSKHKLSSDIVAKLVEAYEFNRQNKNIIK